MNEGKLTRDQVAKMYAHDEVMQTSAPLSPIAKRVSTLDTELCELTDAILRLTDRINGILSPDYPEPPNKIGRGDAVPEQPRAPMVNMLNTAIDRVVEQRTRIARLIDRVEL